MNPLLEDLRSENTDIRIEAVGKAADSTDAAIIAELIRMLGDEEIGDGRRHVATSLGKTDHPLAAGHLLELIRTDDETARSFAVIGLGEVQSADSVAARVSALGDNVNTVRNLAERSLLATLESLRTHGVDRLLDALEHPVPLCRSPAARLLGTLGDPRGLEPLVRHLQEDNQWLARMWSAKGLGDLGLPDAFEPLVRAMREDPKNRVRAAAAEAIGKLRLPRSKPALEQALEDPDGGVRMMAEETLAGLEQASLESGPNNA